MVAIDGSKFKAASTHDRNYTAGKIDKRQQQIEESAQRYLDLIESADRISPTGFDVKTAAHAPDPDYASPGSFRTIVSTASCPLSGHFRLRLFYAQSTL